MPGESGGSLGRFGKSSQGVRGEFFFIANFAQNFAAMSKIKFLLYSTGSIAREGDWWFHQLGDTMGTWVVRAEDIVGEQRSDPSLAWLVPQQGFWSDDEVRKHLCLFWIYFWATGDFPKCIYGLVSGHPQRIQVCACLWWLSHEIPGFSADPKEELHPDKPLRIFHGLWRTKLCNDGWG